MEESLEPEAAEAHGRRAGAMLAEARAQAKLELAEVSARTRIPQRHLAAIEAGDYAELPSRTYAVGFAAPTHAWSGSTSALSPNRCAPNSRRSDPQGPLRPDRFEPGDPARVPSRRLAAVRRWRSWC